MTLWRCQRGASNVLADTQCNSEEICLVPGNSLDYDSSTRGRPCIYCQHSSGYPPVIILVYVNDNDLITLALLRQMREIGPLLHSPIRFLPF
jgi:hypothetical protein